MNAQVTKSGASLPDGFVGIRLESAPLGVRGVFRLPLDAARAIDRHRHRAIVVLVTRPGSFEVASPLRERVLFDADEELADGMTRGFFSVDLARSGASYVVASLGPYVSNVVEF
jgi:hypothetical protein